MSYRREVENLLGKECITKLLNYVRGGHMSDDQIMEFVLQLGELSETDSEAPNVLLGDHKRRMERFKDRAQDTELLQVMYDWWENRLYEMTRDRAMDILIKALSLPNVKCKHLAKEISPLPSQV